MEKSFIIAWFSWLVHEWVIGTHGGWMRDGYWLPTGQ